MQLVMSGLVLLAGLYVVVFADTSPNIRLFGWVLVAVGLLGLASTAILRRLRR
jgi:hypothetical protein